MPTVYLNGQFVPREQALVPVEDRGLLFADGIYEVIRYYRGHAFRFEAHFARLLRSAAGIGLPLALDQSALQQVTDTLVQRDGLGDANVYIQITRGVSGPRNHAWPGSHQGSTMFAIARPAKAIPAAWLEQGVSAITHPDLRWARCDLKTVSLLPNVLAKQRAQEAGAFEAILVRDGMAIEGSSTNLFAVTGGTVITAPRSNYILHGITRQVALDLAQGLSIPVREEPVPLADLLQAQEVFITSTTSEVLPISSIDGQPIGSGKAGDISRKLAESFQRLTAALPMARS